jgi:hypothetical protein
MARLTVDQALKTLAEYRIKTVRAPEETLLLGKVLLSHRWFESKKDEGAFLPRFDPSISDD